MQVFARFAKLYAARIANPPVFVKREMKNLCNNEFFCAKSVKKALNLC